MSRYICRHGDTYRVEKTVSGNGAWDEWCRHCGAVRSSYHWRLRFAGESASKLWGFVKRYSPNWTPAEPPWIVPLLTKAFINGNYGKAEDECNCIYCG